MGFSLFLSTEFGTAVWGIWGVEGLRIGNSIREDWEGVELGEGNLVTKGRNWVRGFLKRTTEQPKRVNEMNETSEGVGF